MRSLINTCQELWQYKKDYFSFFKVGSNSCNIKIPQEGSDEEKSL